MPLPSGSPAPGAPVPGGGRGNNTRAPRAGADAAVLEAEHREAQPWASQGAVENSPPCRQDPEVSPGEGSRGRPSRGQPGVQPALQQGRVEAAELGLQREHTAQAHAGSELRASCNSLYPSMSSVLVSTCRARARDQAHMFGSGCKDNPTSGEQGREPRMT